MSKPAQQPTTLLIPAIAAALKAGDAILEVYGTSDFGVEEKSDHSPLTLADSRSHNIIAFDLKEIGIPLLSEEGREIPFEERQSWPLLWIVDPLDGTKEFIKRNGEFTVNIALVKQQRPILGVIYVPVTGALYFAAEPAGAFFIDRAGMPGMPGMPESVDEGGDAAWLDRLIASAEKLPLGGKYGPEAVRPYTIMGSRSHATPELSVFVEKMRERHGNVELISAGSSLKFCRVAEGAADIYPRMGPTMEWDTAAGQAIVEMAGGRVYDYRTRLPLGYNKPELTNPWFVVEQG